MRTELPLLSNGYKGRSVKMSAQRRVNLYPEMTQDNKTITALIGTPGLLLFSNICEQPFRGAWTTTLSTKMWAVFGADFYEILQDGTFTKKGSIATSQGTVSFSDNGTHILIVDGSATGFYYVIATGTLTQIVDADFLGGTKCTWIDGYFFTNDPGTGKVRSCTAPSGTAPSSWNALDVAIVEGDPDNLIAPVRHNLQLWLLGDFSTEVYYNAANATGLPFSRINGAVLPVGIAAAHSLAEVGGSLFWLAKTKQGDRFIVRTDGYSPVPISDNAVEYLLGQMSNVSDAVGFGYRQEGHSFYEITFPTGDLTLVYDLTTGLWHERKSRGIGRHRILGYAFFNGKHIVGDYATGKLYELDLDTYTDDGEMITRTLAWPHIRSASGEKVTLNRLELEMETGVGLQPDQQGEDPVASLRISRDGGSTWGNERTRTIGKVGEKKKKVYWNACGSGYDLVPEVSISDPVPVVITGGIADLEVEE